MATLIPNPHPHPNPNPATQVEKPTEVPLSAAQRERGTTEHAALLQQLRKLSVLRCFSDDDLGPLLCACRLRSYPRYAAILRGEAPGPSCCLLLSGVAASLPKDAKAGSALVPTVVTKGAVLDEGGLVTEVHRAASLSAVTDCLLLFLSHAALSAAYAPHPQLRDALHGTAEWAEVQRDAVQHLLQRRCFFRDLSEKDLVGLSSIFEVRHLGAGAVVFKEGSKGDCFYVLVDGEVPFMAYCTLISYYLLHATSDLLLTTLLRTHQGRHHQEHGQGRRGAGPWPRPHTARVHGVERAAVVWRALPMAREAALRLSHGAI